MARDDPNLRAKLKQKCEEEKAPYTHIENDDECIVQQRAHDNTTRGVIVFHRRYARGTNIKLATNAKVLIFGNQNTLMYSEAIQMVGRGVRDAGQGEGVLFLMGDPNL